MTEFDVWLDAVNDLAMDDSGVGIDDGIDWPSRDAFDDGCTIEEGYDIWLEWQA